MSYRSLLDSSAQAGPILLFQEFNSTKSKKEWLNLKKVNVFEWPNGSPDLKAGCAQEMPSFRAKSRKILLSSDVLAMLIDIYSKRLMTFGAQKKKYNQQSINLAHLC